MESSQWKNLEENWEGGSTLWLRTPFSQLTALMIRSQHAEGKVVQGQCAEISEQQDIKVMT